MLLKSEAKISQLCIISKKQKKKKIQTFLNYVRVKIEVLCSHSFVLNISDVLSSLTITGWVKFLAIVRHNIAKAHIKNYIFFSCLDSI